MVTFFVGFHEKPSLLFFHNKVCKLPGQVLEIGFALNLAILQVLFELLDNVGAHNLSKLFFGICLFVGFLPAFLVFRSLLS